MSKPGTRFSGFPYPLIALVAPSGAGKTTLSQRLVRELGLRRVVSCTTRDRRADEPNDAYRFLTEEAFRRGIEAGEFIEWVQPFEGSALYGRRWDDAESVLSHGPGLADMTEHGIQAFRAAGIPVYCVRIEPRNVKTLPHAAARSAADAARAEIPIDVDAVVINDHADPEGLERAYGELSTVVRHRLAR